MAFITPPSFLWADAVGTAESRQSLVAKLNILSGDIAALNVSVPFVPISIVNGGTGAPDAVSARVNLGLGTLATQNATAVSIAGGSASLLDLSINGAAATARPLYLKTAGSLRWVLYANSGAEGGANAGSDLALGAYTDAGAFLNNYLMFTRSTGKATFLAEVQIGGDLNHDGANVGLFGSTPVARTALAAATGTIKRTTFDTATVTLPQLAGVVMAMLADLRATGYWS